MKKDSKKTIIEFDKNSKSTYDKFSEYFSETGKSPTNLELFIFAMCFGFQNGNKVDAITKSGTGVRLEYLKPADELLMGAIQFADTKDETSLLDQEQRYELAERYAEGGIRLLKNMMDDPGNFIQDLSSQVVPLLKNFKA